MIGTPRSIFLAILLVLPASRALALEGGYASLTSVAQGESIDLHISTAAPDPSIEIYREGAPRMLMRRITGLRGGEYPCGEPGYRDGCGWPVAHHLEVPREWPSGVYIAEFTTGVSGAGTRLIQFVVREDEPGSTAPILFTLASNTHNAYNGTGGKSLYPYNSSGGVSAVTVSYDRPYDFAGDGKYYEREHPFVRWAESAGFPLEYATNVDLHRDPDLLSRYSCFVLAGHDEYWSREMRDHLDAFVRAGGNAAILGGNTCWWQVRFSTDLRRMHCWKATALKADPYAIDGDPSNDVLVTTNWYRPPVSYPENSTTGLGWRHGGYHNTNGKFLAEDGFGGYRVYRTFHWAFEGTGLADGDSLGKEAAIVGYEVDGTRLAALDTGGALAWDADGHYPLPGALPHVIETEITRTPASFEVLGLAPATSGHAVLGLFEVQGGGTVFNAGTIEWVSGLASDERVSRITSNVLGRFTGLDPASNDRPSAVIDVVDQGSGQGGAWVKLAGHGTDADGTITGWRWRSTRDGFLADSASFEGATLSSGTHTILFAVRDDRGAWSRERSVTIEVSGPGDPESFVLDEGQPGTTAYGNWIASEAPGAYGPSSLYSRDPSATYTFDIPVAEGTWEVFAHWTQFPSRRGDVPIEVRHARGTDSITVDQERGGGEWRSLGVFQFRQRAVVIVVSLGVDTTSADAVKVVRAGPR